MNKISKLVVITMAVAAATTAGLKAGSTSYIEESAPISGVQPTFSLTVQGGKPSGNYQAGTQVTVSADLAPAGAEFLGWTGDIAILANPFLPKTTATMPYMAVTINAIYTAPAASFLPPIDPNWGG